MTEPMNDERAIALLDWLSGTNGGIVSIDDIDALNPYIAKRFREMVAAVPRPDPPEVDDAMVERAAIAISNRHLSNTGVPFPIKACRDDARAALTAALKPATGGTT